MQINLREERMANDRKDGEAISISHPTFSSSVPISFIVSQ